jgi:hypothetical protein
MTRDGVTDLQIFERDGWQCLVPGCELGAVIRGLPWDDPYAPTIDHIIPLSRGGTDTAANKRTAHWICNVRRGNRIGPEDVQIVTPELAPLGILPVLREPGVLKPKPLCAECGKAPVTRAGSRCWGCRHAKSAAKRLQVLACREAGMTWDEAAKAAGLSGSGAAHNLAYSNPPGQPPMPAPRKRKLAADLDKRLWWTTVRPA